ncbi:MAG: sporulation protein YqfD [Lachnospiraceae bacterium]|nr:sporulation protein YqfD [Lachnospiraceae bacterium]
MDWFLHGFRGFMVVRLTGYSPERFLNLCNSRGIPIWGLEYRNGGYEFCMTLDGFWQVRPLVRKSQVRLRIKKRVGLPFFLQRNRSRVGFGAGFLLFFILLYGMSLFIWDIQVEGNRRYTYEMITDYLNTREITWGMPKANIDCEALEASLRDYFPEITWAAARISGTRLLIAVKENEVMSHIPEKDETPCDLVASKPGVISEIIVRQGKAQVKAGDQVEAGQVLISGSIPIYDDSGQIQSVRQVRADGDVTADTEYAFSQQFPLVHTVEADTGGRKYGLRVTAGKWSAVLLLPSDPEETWVYQTNEYQAKIFSSFYLPVYWGTIIGKEVDRYEAFYTKSEIQQVSEGIYQNFVKNLSEKGVQIIENDVKILEDESVCRMEGVLRTRESITQVQRITEPKETENIEYERSGEHD